MNGLKLLLSTCLVAALALTACPVAGQTMRVPQRAFASNVLMPQSRIPVQVLRGRTAPLQITAVDARVSILNQVATTVLTVDIKNPGAARAEAELLIPVPRGVTVRGFDFQGAAGEPTAELLPARQARQTYDGIVAKMKDPALLEFVDCALVRSSVFPVEAHGTQKVRLTWEQVLPRDGARVDYLIPRSESLDYRVPWTITVDITSRHDISAAYSPSHNLSTTRRGPKHIAVSLARDGSDQPGAFRLSYLAGGKDVSASLFTYPDPAAGGGYFLLLAGVPPEPGPRKTIPREVTLVLDRSGSMNGPKLKQVREAAKQIVAALQPGETFNIIAYSNTVELFSTKPVVKSDDTEAAARTFLDRLNSRVGTNLHDALVEALRQKPTPGKLPLVLFLTDGLPTIGQTSETTIRRLATHGNPHRRRVFTFGVGVDVNTPLLDGLATDSRATATYVLPEEDVEVKVAGVFKKLTGPVLTDVQLEAQPADGPVKQPRVFDVLPARLSDIFEGDQIVVLGRYRGEDPLVFELTGTGRGTPRRFTFRFSLEKATTANAFVPRLWASRQIGTMVEQARALGADGVTVAPDDPRMKELVDEIVRLSRRFGILTEYTAFLATEGTNLDMKFANAQTGNELVRYGQTVRTGKHSVSQSFNAAGQRGQVVLNRSNTYFDSTMNRVSVTSVQQVADRAMYNRGGNWIDSRTLEDDGSVTIDRRVVFGSEAWHKLVARLARDNRSGIVSMRGNLVIEVDGQSVLVTPTEVDLPRAVETLKHQANVSVKLNSTPGK